MNDRIPDRLFAAAGEHQHDRRDAGVIIGSTGGRQFVTITRAPADIAAALAKPVGTAWPRGPVRMRRC
jgi:hypothetical protein